MENRKATNKYGYIIRKLQLNIEALKELQYDLDYEDLISVEARLSYIKTLFNVSYNDLKNIVERGKKDE